MQFFSFFSLDGKTPLQTSVVIVLTTQVAVGFHGHDGMCTAQFIFVLDFHHTLFSDPVIFQEPLFLFKLSDCLPLDRDLECEKCVRRTNRPI